MLKRLSQCSQSALSLGVSVELVVLVLSTSHQGRLTSLFNEAAKRFLVAFTVAKGNPQSKSAKHQLLRAKAILDLICVRKAWVGQRRPSLSKCIDMFDVVRTQFMHLSLVARAA